MQELIIQTKDLTKIYGEQTVADRVNIHIRQGKIYGLLGYDYENDDGPYPYNEGRN